MQNNQLKKLFNETLINNNFKYLIDEKIIDRKYKDTMYNIYNEILDSLKYYKTYYPEFSRKMRSICTTIIRKALELFDIPASNTDNTNTQLLQLFNDNTLTTRNDVAEFAVRLAGIDVNRTIDNFRKGKAIIWLNSFDRETFHQHDTMNWTSNGSVTKFYNMKFKSNDNLNLSSIVNAYDLGGDTFYSLLISSIKDFSLVMQNYVLRNMNQKFLSYIIHNTPGVNPFYNEVTEITDEEQGVKNITTKKDNVNEKIYMESMHNPYKFLESTVNFINKFLIELCITKFKCNIDKNEYYVNFDLFNIDNYEVINILKTNNKHYKLYLAREKSNDNYNCYIIQEYEFNELVDEKLFYNTNETASAMANCSGIIDIKEIRFGNPKSDKYKLYAIKVGSYKVNEESLHIKTLYPEDLNSFSLSEKAKIINDLFEMLNKMHYKKLFLRYMDLDSFVINKHISKDGSDSLQLNIISIEYSKRTRIDNSITVKNYIPTGGAFSQIDGLLSVDAEKNDLSKKENALIADVLYAVFMALYILSNSINTNDLRISKLQESITRIYNYSEVNNHLQNIFEKFKSFTKLLGTNEEFEHLRKLEKDMFKSINELLEYLGDNEYV